MRVKDFQEVVVQPLRSRRQFPSTTLWAELANRLSGQGQPVATLIEGSDDAGLLSRRLGLTDDDVESPWTRRYPAVRGALGIVQPGLSAQSLRSQLNEVPIPPAAQSLRELFSVLTDMAQSRSGTCYCRLAVGAGLTRALLASNTRLLADPHPHCCPMVVIAAEPSTRVAQGRRVVGQRKAVATETGAR